MTLRTRTASLASRVVDVMVFVVVVFLALTFMSCFAPVYSQVVNPPAASISTAAQNLAPTNLVNFTQVIDARRGYVVNLMLTNSISNAVAVTLDLSSLGTGPYPLVLNVANKATVVHVLDTNRVVMTGTGFPATYSWFGTWGAGGFRDESAQWYVKNGPNVNMPDNDGDQYFYIGAAPWVLARTATCSGGGPTGTLTAVNTVYLWGAASEVNGAYAWNGTAQWTNGATYFIAYNGSTGVNELRQNALDMNHIIVSGLVEDSGDYFSTESYWRNGAQNRFVGGGGGAFPTGGSLYVPLHDAVYAEAYFGDGLNPTGTLSAVNAIWLWGEHGDENFAWDAAHNIWGSVDPELETHGVTNNVSAGRYEYLQIYQGSATILGTSTTLNGYWASPTLTGTNRVLVTCNGTMFGPASQASIPGMGADTKATRITVG